MDSLISASARALAAGDPLGALQRVALRDDPLRMPGWHWCLRWPRCAGAMAQPVGRLQRVAGLSTPLLLALAALGVHILAMLAVTGAMAAAACQAVQAAQRWLQRHRRCSGDPAR